jgi:hypothetical protein
MPVDLLMGKRKELAISVWSEVPLQVGGKGLSDFLLFQSFDGCQKPCQKSCHKSHLQPLK